MKAERISTKWIGKMAFESELNGHKIILDATDKVGGENKGPRPKPLMQLSVAGCTAMDIISILKKMKVEVDDFQVHVDGDFSEEHPVHYTNMHIIYEFTGKNLSMKKIEKAVSLSQDRYCGVSYSYKKAMELTHEIIVHDTK